MHAELDEIVEYLKDRLRLADVPDYPGAVNGLQLGNNGSVTKIGAAVDASLAAVEGAVAAGVDFLIVHHGMFWQGAQPIDGALYRKLKAAIDANLAIFSAHIPLDVHGTYGNNILLAEAIGLRAPQTFLAWKGIEIGLRFKTSITRDQLVRDVEKAVGAKPHVCAAGPESIRNVGLITGGAGGEILAVAKEGIDTFITGEGPHWSFTSAEDLGMNVIYAGHYATETFGVKALGAHIADRCQIPHEFIDRPTGI